MSLKRGALLAKVETSSLKKEEDGKQTCSFKVGDTVDVHQWILEGYDKDGNEKRRIQIYSGTVIAIKGDRHRELFTVRRLVDGQGVERTFPTHSPKIAKIVLKRSGIARRAKLFYLRDRVGKAVRVHKRKKNIASGVGARAGMRKQYHSYLKVNLPEPTGKPTISAHALNTALDEVVSSRK